MNLAIRIVRIIWVRFPNSPVAMSKYLSFDGETFHLKWPLNFSLWHAYHLYKNQFIFSSIGGPFNAIGKIETKQ